ncbi:DUF1045 domain-containing protein [Thalassospira sp.]|uniref:DUF1045 domain-containing protein n=1 Tax=Thalassospira sp. TaxID=1912094 RepID=UPI000C42C044|nr:DUF1045 domain-containing protein [Thalassospira sp.]MBC05221.1 hypothetical protein [Thalassospira sp.]|tara:strand:+ start:7742 stop:8443 length:702 start_codon:yes stop_codon:yes gene_type:complete
MIEQYQRYGIYYAPEPQSALGQFGNTWLGRDPESSDSLARPAVTGLSDADIAAGTTSPRRYGFHGTLKPPFALSVGKDRAELEASLASLCQTIAPVACGPLMLKSIGRFLALVPTKPVAPLADLAATLVRELDAFRQPEDEAAMNKRRAAGLTDRQEENLVRWGYPYVMEEFRFHLTLTNKLSDDQIVPFTNALSDLVATLCEAPFVVREVCLFGDPGDQKPFRLLKRFPLAG